MRSLRLAELPRDPRRSGSWPATAIASVGRAEGLAKADVDGDGKVDLIGGGYWFRHEGGSDYRPMLIDEGSKLTRAAAGQLVEGGPPEVVFVAGDVVGRLKWFERRGDAWIAHDLLGEDVVHGHSLQLADIDEDGHLDIFCAEMAKWTDAAKEPDHPNARMWIFYGDGRGDSRRRRSPRGSTTTSRALPISMATATWISSSNPTTSARPGWTSGSTEGRARRRK